MKSTKVIFKTEQAISNKYSLENEVGLSTYDLALISINKIIKKSKSGMKEVNKNLI